MDLAPVLDVYRQAGNFIDQYQRSYSSNPSVVSTDGAQMSMEMQGTGVAATAKHFPGLGAAATAQNTDLVPVTLNVPLTQLRATDESVYQTSIGAGLDVVMVSWAVYPALDPSRPAGLSPTVVQGELRGRLGFRGVTVSDSLGAGALTAYGSPPQRGVLAAAAGLDLLLFSSTTDAVGGQAALQSALQSGVLPGSAFAAEAERVVTLRTSVSG
jgi:beta-N-acetylhexosaminidase